MPAYAVYFDYKRQSDPNFRKSLKKNNKKVEQTAKQEAEAGAAARVVELKNALEQVKRNGELPTDLEEKESFFMSQVALGESLCASEGKLNSSSHPISIPKGGIEISVTRRNPNKPIAN